MELEQPINAYVCQYCKGSFDKLENLSKHVQKIHTVCSSGKENRICPLCGTQCIKIEGYRNHLRHIHGHNEEGQVVTFKSFNDFLVWKNELEKRNYCKYVMRDPPKRLPSNDKIHIYRCDSSVGSMKEKKGGVAVKENCPAVITAIESVKTKGVKIEHWNSHVGHIIPVEEDELDAAIGSLGTTEIVLSSDQRYQYEAQSADGNLFFITESNDGSLSETFAKESPKKSSNLFQNTKAKISESFSKPSSQKFSYKKDPTKKSGSFSHSLASVACMKPRPKKNVQTPPATANSETDDISTIITNSDELVPTPDSSVPSSEVELATESIIDVTNADISSKTDTPVKSKEKETPATHASPSKIISITNTNNITNQTFEFINDGSLSGQVVLLNSLPGQNGNQNVLLCSDQKFITIGPPISVETVTPKKGKASKKSQKNIAPSQIIVIPTTSEKENVSSVHNVLNLSQNSIPLDSIVRTPGPSILKRAKKSVQKAPKKSAKSTGKNITVAGKNSVSTGKKNVSTEQKQCLGLNPSLDVTVMDAVESTQSTNSLEEIVQVVDSELLEVNNSTPNTSSTSINFATSIEDTVTASPPLITNNSVPPAVKNFVSSSSESSVSSSGQSSVSSSTNQSSVSSSAIQSSVSSAIQSSVSSAIQNSISSATQNTVSSGVQNSVPSSIPNIQPINPIFLNSFPPGQTFMSINNNLIPIGTPTAPLLPSNFSPGFVLTSPVPPSPVTRPGRPRMNHPRPRMAYPRPRMTYSRLTARPPVKSSTLPVGFPDKKTQYKQTNIGTATRQKAPPHTSNVPLLLIPNSGNQISPSVPFSSPFVASNVNSTLASSIRPNRTQPIISNSLISHTGCSALSRPLIRSNGAPVFTQLSPGTQLIPTPIIPNIQAPFLSSNGQQISRPMLQNVPLLTGQQIPRSILQNISFTSPLIGQPAVAPIAPRPIISTTVSNTIKVQKVQLPFSKTTITSPSVSITGIAGVNTTLTEATKVSSVMLNTEPISSAPAISIPPLASIGSHKPGSVIFESQGDIYMLEPVEENSQINNNTSAKNVPNKVSIAIPSSNGNTKTNKSNERRESTFEGNKANLSSLQKEKASLSHSTLDTRADGKVKSLSPRKSIDTKNGVQIKSVVQEKRHLKDDDVEILKKVKYYQMEMKYLASQAECKRLKLELARAQMKNKEITKNNTDLLPGEISMQGNAEGALDVDVTSGEDNLELKQTSCVENVIEDLAMDVDVSQEVADISTEDKTKGVQAIDKIESTNQSDVDLSDSTHGGDILAESGDSNSGDINLPDLGDSNHSNSPADLGDSNHSNNPADLEDSNHDNSPADLGDSNHTNSLADLGDSKDSNSPADLGDSKDSNSPADLGDSKDSNSPADLGDSKDSNSPADLGDSKDSNSPADSGVSNHSDNVDLSTKLNQTKDSLEAQSSHHDLGDLSCDIGSDVGSNLETPKETCSPLNEEFQITNTLKNTSNNSTPCETSKTDSNEHLKDTDKSTLIDESFDNQFHNQDDELMDISELEETFKDATGDNPTTIDSENADIFEVQESTDKQMHMSSKESVQNNNLDDKEHLGELHEFCQQKVINEDNSMDLDDHNSSSFETEKINPPCDKSQFQETLKELEFQYGGEESSDIYTMIRTSVLRSLYDDMKTLCEENKKLYEKLQNSRSQESCETDKLCS